MKLNIRCGDKIREVNAYRIIAFPDIPEEKFFIHRVSPNRVWILSEYTTGMLCVSGRTIKLVKSYFANFINNRDAAYIKNHIANARSQFGIIN